MPDDLQFIINTDFDYLNIQDRIEFVGEFTNPYPTYSMANVFLLSSREDPFPLVCLEHAVLGKPIICFDKGTGIKEFVENDAGVIVPYFDIEATVEAIKYLYDNHDVYSSLSRRSAEKASQYDINIQAKLILNEIYKLIN